MEHEKKEKKEKKEKSSAKLEVPKEALPVAPADVDGTQAEITRLDALSCKLQSVTVYNDRAELTCVSDGAHKAFDSLISMQPPCQGEPEEGTPGCRRLRRVEGTRALDFGVSRADRC